MSVYIEYVIADNYVMTYIIARTSCRILKNSLSKLRLHMACAVGTVGAICYPFVRSIYLTVAFKSVLWMIMSLILFAKKRKFFACAVVFLGVTAGFAGAIIMIGLASDGYAGKEYFFSFGDLPISVIVVPSLIAYTILKKIVISVNRNRDLKNLEYDAEFSIGSDNYRVKGLLDTGNRLYDSNSGLPIVVVSLCTVFASLSPQKINECLGSNGGGMSFYTVGGKSGMAVVKPDFFRLYLRDGKNIFIDVMLGVIPGRLNGGYGAILSPAVI